MKKLIALLAICAMGTALMAADFSETNWKNGGFTLPVAYTGTIKAAGWADEGLCYNWEKDKGSLPLFLGVCQPCLECVPCDIDMKHAAPVVQYNASPAVADALAANPPTPAAVDPTEAFFNRARLYIVTDVDKSAKTVTIQVVDLIDAYGTSKPYSTFQFYNTVDSKDNELKPENGRIAAFFSFPIIQRTSGYPYILNQYSAALGSTDDGIGMASLIGNKDKKNWFKYGSAKYKIVAIKKMDGDLMLAQGSFTDTPCRAGADYIYGSALAAENPEYDGEGAWWATASISLRRNDAVTKKMMNAVVAEAGSVNCIPCNVPGSVVPCREYLDQGMVDLLIDKKFKSHTITYLVDTDLDYVYGDPATVSPAPVTRAQALTGRTAYLADVKAELTAQTVTVP